VGTWYDPELGRPIAAPLERCAELLGVDLATIQQLAADVEPYLRADGTKVWSLMQLERRLRPQAYRRRPAAPGLRPRPRADTFEDVVQELGAVKAALQHRAATGENVERLLEAAEWLDRRGGELLGRDRSASQPAG